MDQHSSRDELGALLSHLHARREKLDLPVADTPDQDVVIVAVILLRAAMVQGSAVHQLTGTPNAEAASANIRQLFEAWIDLRYLLLEGDRVENSHRCIVFAHLELFKFLKKHGEGIDMLEANADNVEGVLQRLRSETPQVFAKVEKEKAQYWSGMGRKVQIRKVGESTQYGAEGLERQYKFYSWDAHHIMNVVRDYRVAQTEEGLEVGFGFGLNPVERGEDYCAQAVLFLTDCWETFVKVFPQRG